MIRLVRATRLSPVPSPCHSFRRFTTSSAYNPQNVAVNRTQEDSDPLNGLKALEEEKYANVVGTVPYHASYTLLRHSNPPLTYPPKLDGGFSPLGRKLMVQAVRRKGIVNFWSEGEGESKSDGVEKRLKDGHEQERYPYMTFYAPGYEHAHSNSSSQLGVGVQTGIVSSTQNAEAFFDSPDSSAVNPWDEHYGVYLLVCTHGARDCRCGVRGVSLVDSLRKALDALRIRDGADSVWERIRVGEVGHVGGHKFAPNLLVFPFGDWLAQLNNAHVPTILYGIASRLELLRRSKSIDDALNQERVMEQLLAPLIVDESIWRGRMGLTKEEQVQLFERYKSSALI